MTLWQYYLIKGLIIYVDNKYNILKLDIIKSMDQAV